LNLREERGLPEAEPPKAFDVITFHLQFCLPKRDYPDERSLREELKGEVAKAIGSRPELQGKALLLEGSNPPSASLLGVDFRPDLVVELEGNPQIAILFRLLKGGAPGLARALGQALVLSYQYPWVLAFILDKGKRSREKRALDHAFRADMWHNRHVRFLFL
jgi:hypothetical protein